LSEEVGEPFEALFEAFEHSSHSAEGGNLNLGSSSSGKIGEGIGLDEEERGERDSSEDLLEEADLWRWSLLESQLASRTGLKPEKRS
jgi:hypothetical protein